MFTQTCIVVTQVKQLSSNVVEDRLTTLSQVSSTLYLQAVVRNQHGTVGYKSLFLVSQAVVQTQHRTVGYKIVFSKS